MNTPVANAKINISVPWLAGTSANGSSELPSSSLTPEMLLVYCQSRLGTLDDQIQSLMKEQERNGKRAADMTKLLSAANRPSVTNTAEIGTKAGTSEREASKANELRDVYLNSDDPEVKQAAAEEFRITTGQDIADYPEGKDVTAANMEQWANTYQVPGDNETAKAKRLDTYKNELAELNNGAELKMIELQGLISKRQLAVQLTTQGLQTLNETSKSIVGNIGR